MTDRNVILEAVPLGDRLWLGRCHPRKNPMPSPGNRRTADRRSARRALTSALTLANLDRRASRVSLSHTEGVGAALVGPPHLSLGVDVVRVGRATKRHARAVMTPRELEILEGQETITPDHVWAVKEAASKATGNPLEYFPMGIRIVACHPERLLLKTVKGPRRTYSAGWQEMDGFLYAWAVGEDRGTA